jgi:heme-degrading monooxygenase HmoA
MFAVIFEVQPRPGARDAYLALARLLRPELERIDGFIDNERFASRQTAGRVLSLSTWRDEQALIRWRTLGAHHTVQEIGRRAIFADYHLRVGEITADTQLPSGHTLTQQRFDSTSVGAARIVTIGETPPDATSPALDVFHSAAGLLTLEQFEGINVPGKALTLAGWRDDAALTAWQAGQPHDPASRIRQRTVRIIRDYGMGDDARAEAPQYYPPLGAPADAAHGQAR